MFNAIFPFQRNSPGIFPNNESSSVALSSGEQYPKFGITFIRSHSITAERLQLLQHRTGPRGCLRGALAGPAPFVFDGQWRQTVIGGLRDPYTSVCQVFMSEHSVQLLGFSESDLFSKGTGFPA